MFAVLATIATITMGGVAFLDYFEPYLPAQRIYVRKYTDNKVKSLSSEKLASDLRLEELHKKLIQGELINRKVQLLQSPTLPPQLRFEMETQIRSYEVELQQIDSTIRDLMAKQKTGN